MTETPEARLARLSKLETTAILQALRCDTPRWEPGELVQRDAARLVEAMADRILAQREMIRELEDAKIELIRRIKALEPHAHV